VFKFLSEMAQTIRNIIHLARKLFQPYRTHDYRTNLNFTKSISKITVQQAQPNIIYSTAHGSNIDSNVPIKRIQPPTGQCCMEGCINCVWIEYVDSLVEEYKGKISVINIKDVLEEVDKDVDNPSVRSYIKFEIKSKFK